MANKHKLSATALSCFLESPKAYFWRYIRKLETLNLSAANFDHDRIAGSLWSEFVDRFYRKVPEKRNTDLLLANWDEQTDGWLGKTSKDKLTDALKAWSTIYYQRFSPTDGVRNGSEKHVENDRFHGYLDGLSHDGKIVHEVKSTSRAKSVSEQLWKVQRSIQVKLYTVLTGAEGVLIEFAYKDPPHDIYRSEVLPITAEQRKAWEQELNALADRIYSLGDDEHNYPCHPDGCCIISKGFTSVCDYAALCDRLEGAEIGFKQKENRRK